MEELNKKNIPQNEEEIVDFVPTEEDFVTDDVENYNENKHRKIVKKSKKLEKAMQEEGLSEEEALEKYGEESVHVTNEPEEYEDYEDEDLAEYNDEENESEEEYDEETEKENDTDEDDDDEEEYEEDDDDDEGTSLIDSGEFPQEITDLKLECLYIGLLLNNPKAISMYYFVYDECLFSDEELSNIYKIILFQDGEAFAPAIAKEKFKFPKENTGTYDFKMQLKNAVKDRNYSLEDTYTKLKKLFILKKNYRSAPTLNIQNKIVEISQYERYSEMTIEEVESAIEQIGVTNRLSQAILNEGATEFLISGENDLVGGVPLPFPILSSVFKGLRKGETMAYAMPSNSGKSRFTVDIATYLALVERKKVLIISNEMSEEKMRLCLITTIVNNKEIQKLHKQNLCKTEGELLALQFRPDANVKDVELDEDGFIKKRENEDNNEFAKRISKISTEFRETIQVTEWLKKQVDESIHFIHITEHSNEDLKKIYNYSTVDHTMKRIKSPQSILDKMKKKNYNLNYKELIENINDIAGVRVICPLRKDVYDIIGILQESQEIRIISEKDYIKRPKKSGYSSYHIIVEVPVEFEGIEMYVKVEIQIRTMAMDFWATIEHHAKYKTKNKLSKRDSRKLVTYAKIINKLDEKMMEILDE